MYFPVSNGIVDAYIQGTKDGNGVWRYDDGSEILFLPWGTKQPSNGQNEVHLDVWSGDFYQYHDVKGTLAYGFICEINLK